MFFHLPSALSPKMKLQHMRLLLRKRGYLLAARGRVQAVVTGVHEPRRTISTGPNRERWVTHTYMYGYDSSIT